MFIFPNYFSLFAFWCVVGVRHFLCAPCLANGGGGYLANSGGFLFFAQAQGLNVAQGRPVLYVKTQARWASGPWLGRRLKRKNRTVLRKFVKHFF